MKRGYIPIAALGRALLVALRRVTLLLVTLLLVTLLWVLLLLRILLRVLISAVSAVSALLLTARASTCLSKQLS